jgi:ribosome-binding factor A
MTRVNELIKRELAGLIEEDRVWANNILVSVTTVNTSTDLRNATVGISIFGGTPSEKQKIMAELDLRKVKWQDDLASELGFKRTPVLAFKIDTSIERGDRVFALLNKNENQGEEQ